MNDLSNFSMAQLRDLQTQVAEQIKVREKDEIAKVQQQILALASDVGMSVEQIMGFKTTKAKKPVAVRYQHPERQDEAVDWPRPPADMGQGVCRSRKSSRKTTGTVIFR